MSRTTAHTLASLQSLRIALREHVRSQRAHGATLPEIDGRLREMIDVAADGHGHSRDRIAEVRLQVLNWSEGFYSR